MNREMLEKPFTPDQIKQREGNFGKTLDYIEGHAVIARLNESFESLWSFSILEHKVMAECDEVIVLGQLRAGEVVKTQFGSSRITRNRDTSEMVSIADDMKAAATDALKKCATMLGVGLHLYDRGNVKPATNSSGNGGNGSRPQQGNGGYQGQSHQSNGNGNGNGNGRLSSKQYNYILSLASDKGINQDALNQKCVTAYGSVAAHLSKGDASSIIKVLMAA
jgi:hypothetical protein